MTIAIHMNPPMRYMMLVREEARHKEGKERRLREGKQEACTYKGVKPKSPTEKQVGRCKGKGHDQEWLRHKNFQAVTRGKMPRPRICSITRSGSALPST